ncbi:uncharacterized protein VcgC/VcgE DUF2780 [Alteromonadaceae bacterium 2753L.S.0a.02]|nr:uncharacterized protein VcgC/VcgE DUF2780 [Alteromonadaceae bacterium 2753L.S.0a.02]
MKKALPLLFLVLIAAQAQAGIWDTISSWFGDSEEQATETAQPAAASTTDTLVQQGIALLPFVMQQLGVTETQASGGVGALLQAATALLSDGESKSLLAAIPNATKLMASAPKQSGETSNMLSGALKAAGEYSETAKVASQLTSQFDSLGLSADKIPAFTKTTQSYLDQTDNEQAGDLLGSALASLL